MVDVTPLIRPGLNIIQKYGKAGFRIGGADHAGAIIVTADTTTPWGWDSADLAKSLQNLAGTLNDIEVLIIGTGSRGILMPPTLRQPFRDKKIAVESMDTGAACRTYNVLIAEGRLVAAALVPVS